MKAILFVFLFLISVNAKSQSVIDQFDTSYSAGLSARTLSGYSWYQTFTAGLTGVLTEFDAGFFNFINGVGTIRVFEDTGISGNMIYSSLINVNCPSGGCLLPFLVNCNVVAGNRYTFHFIPGTGLPDPYGVQMDFSNSYTGGEMYLIDPSGTYPLNMDLVFVTYVQTESAGLEEAKPDAGNLFHISGSSVVLSENIRGSLFSELGQQVEMSNLPDGIYFLRIFFNNKNLIFKVCIN